MKTYESFESSPDGALAYAALAQGARAHPELAELLAGNPEGVVLPPPSRR